MPGGCCRAWLRGEAAAVPLPSRRAAVPWARICSSPTLQKLTSQGAGNGNGKVCSTRFLLSEITEPERNRSLCCCSDEVTTRKNPVLYAGIEEMAEGDVKSRARVKPVRKEALSAGSCLAVGRNCRNTLVGVVSLLTVLSLQEVLAPAGGWPQLVAAVQSGADAVSPPTSPSRFQPRPPLQAQTRAQVRCPS